MTATNARVRYLVLVGNDRARLWAAAAETLDVRYQAARDLWPDAELRRTVDGLTSPLGLLVAVPVTTLAEAHLLAGAELHPNDLVVLSDPYDPDVLPYLLHRIRISPEAEGNADDPHAGRCSYCPEASQ